MKTAFPTERVEGRNTMDDLPAQQGMSLREYYAGQALNGLLSNSIWLTAICKRPKDEDPAIVDHILAKSAFAIADAMVYTAEQPQS